LTLSYIYYYATIHSRAINEAVEKYDIVINDFYINERNSDIHLSLIIPIVIIQKSGVKHIGTVMIIMDPHMCLCPTIKLWPVPSDTGEALLVQREGNDVVFLNELRHIKNMPLMMKYPLTELSLPAVKAVLGWQGVVYGTDYRKKMFWPQLKQCRIPHGSLLPKSILKKYMRP